VRGRVGLRPAAIDRRPDIENDKIWIRAMSVQPLGCHQRLCVRPGDRCGQPDAEKDCRAAASHGSRRTELK
jgi:hypothetical protein